LLQQEKVFGGASGKFPNHEKAFGRALGKFPNQEKAFGRALGKFPKHEKPKSDASRKSPKQEKATLFKLQLTLLTYCPNFSISNIHKIVVIINYSLNVSKIILKNL